MGSAITKTPRRGTSVAKPQVIKQWSKMRGWTQKAYSIEGDAVPTIKINVDSPTIGRSKSERDPGVKLRQKKSSFDSAAGGTKMSVNLSKTLSPFTRRFSHRRSYSAPTIKPTMFQLPEEEQLTGQLVDSWLDPNTGFESLLQSREGRRLFEEFLKKEFSSENIQFWSAVEQLKNLRGGEKIFRQHVDVIFKIYINDTALAEVSLDSKVKRNLMLKKDDPPRDIFEEAQTKIFSLMHRDSYPRFLSSPIFKEVLDKFDCPSSSSSTSSLSRSSSVESVEDRSPCSPQDTTRYSVLDRNLEKEIKEMLEGLKGNDLLQRSVSENSEADQMCEKEKLAKNHVEQILDEIIEEVLMKEEMHRMNSI